MQPLEEELLLEVVEASVLKFVLAAPLPGLSHESTLRDHEDWHLTINSNIFQTQTKY